MNSTAYLLFLCFMVSASKRKTGWSVTCFWSMEFLWVANQPRVASNQWTSPSQSARSPSIVQRDASLLIKDGGCLCMSRRAFDSVVMWKGKLTQKTVGREFCDNLHSLPKNVISGQHFTCAISMSTRLPSFFSSPKALINASIWEMRDNLPRYNHWSLSGAVILQSKTITKAIFVKEHSAFLAFLH